MQPHPSKPAAFVLGAQDRVALVPQSPAAPCAEAYFAGGCKTMRQCLSCQRWQCAERLLLLLCTVCRSPCP